MADNGDRLKRKRATIRALTTRLLQKVERELEGENPNIETLDETIEQLEQKKGILEELNLRIEQDIENLDGLETEVEGSEEYREKIITWTCRARKHIQGNHRSVQGGPEPAPSSGRSGPAAVKLPRLTLDKFNGNAENWQGFWSQFEAAIHGNDALASTDKFNYLRSYLGGTAASAVNGLALSEENYEVAVKILKERFGRRDLIINAHMNRLLNLSPVTKSTEVEELRKLYDACEIQVRSLETLGIVTETYGSLLCPVLMKVIPNDITLEFSRSRNADTDWNVRELLRFLRTEVECRERAILLNKPNPVKIVDRLKYQENNGRNKGSVKPGFVARPSAAALSATTEEACAFCNKTSHITENCKDLTMDERRDRLKKYGRCYICLAKGHIARFCRSKVLCNVCGKRHNKSICNQNEGVPGVKASDVVITSITDHSNNIREKKTVLLQTVTAVALGTLTRSPVRCLLDGGSQRTFIDKEVVRSLGLPSDGEETLHIHTFGNREAKRMTLRKIVVKLCNLWNPEQEVELVALEIPSICGAVVELPGDELKKEMVEKGLQLADVELKNSSIGKSFSILIGGDFYWKVVSGRVERLRGSLVALETVFGWSIQGPTTSSVTTLQCGMTSVMKVVAFEDGMDKQLKAFWELESLGILPETESRSLSDKEALTMFDSQIENRNNRYEVSLPWRLDKSLLENNYRIAKKRFQNLLKKFRTDVNFYDRYKNEVQELIEGGIAEPVPEEEAVPLGAHYIPHHAIVREDKATSKLRVVFDASSHETGCLSLNDCLLPGPNLNPNLLTVLLTFRRHRVLFYKFHYQKRIGT